MGDYSPNRKRSTPAAAASTESLKQDIQPDPIPVISPVPGPVFNTSPLSFPVVSDPVSEPPSSLNAIDDVEAEKGDGDLEVDRPGSSSNGRRPAVEEDEDSRSEDRSDLGVENPEKGAPRLTAAEKGKGKVVELPEEVNDLINDLPLEPVDESSFIEMPLKDTADEGRNKDQAEGESTLNSGLGDEVVAVEEEDKTHKDTPAAPGTASIVIATEPGEEEDEDEDKEEEKDEEGEVGQRPSKGIERPVSRRGTPKTFTIVRLIEHTNKNGDAAVRPAIRVGDRAPWFRVDYGDFLLDLSTPRSENAQVRNYQGQERYIPRRMLQPIYQPWDIPTRIRIRDDGVPLPLAFLLDGKVAVGSKGNVSFETGEAVMVMGKLDGTVKQEVLVTDYERHAGSFEISDLDQSSVGAPWGLLVHAEDLKAAWTKASAPKLQKVPKKRERSEEDDEQEEEEEEEDDGGQGPIEKPDTGKGKKGQKANKNDAADREGTSNKPLTKKARRTKKVKVFEETEDIEDPGAGPSGVEVPETEEGSKQTALGRAARKKKRDAKKKITAKKNTGRKDDGEPDLKTMLAQL
ncbi:hypothetical protein MBM_06295 [Drepanopeziza brunnea f. sp. 'multigermtubi' MB_m1]|uniref:Uncharacterized protein n=1 Tax=Marssonina brunnea f. sp. multigermtubi (strain MB_m1) TaxID=1072389 RepID=K1WTC8_MARBU|nr:uncharacterized protein MBM_06295 [Drepanopeziza brunnea f. sp. 'multigermtubi' MB_m1]EKD15667.1 hypothetical protein MBM_06295 [Drepanopeziza brunnea f. sp. 'multigermtubi' MB_m1]